MTDDPRLEIAVKAACEAVSNTYCGWPRCSCVTRLPEFMPIVLSALDAHARTQGAAMQAEAERQVGEATDLADLRRCVAAFHRWIISNEFTDPEHMLVCAEWHNLCSAAGLDFKMAGRDFHEKYLAAAASGRSE